MRYLPLTPDDRRAMLAKIGAPDIDTLFRDVPREAVVPLSAFELREWARRKPGFFELDRPRVRAADIRRDTPI